MKKILAVALVLMMTMPLVAVPTNADAYDEPSNQPLPDSYEYPVDSVTPVDGTVEYVGDHKYKIHEETKMAFIDIRELDYDTVSFDIADDHDDPWVCFAFLTEMPELDEVVSYAEGYSTFKFACYDCMVDIPANAEYLAFYYSTNDSMNYLPAGITFTKGNTMLENLQDSTLSEYDMPMEYLVADHAVIDYWGEKDNKFIYHKDSEKDLEWKVAVIDITGTVFERVILTPAARKSKWMGYTFLTELPQIGEVVSFASGYNGFKEADSGKVIADAEIEIPEDANYLVVYYMDSYTVLYYPGAISFVNDDPHVHEFLCVETVEATCTAGGYELWKCECEAEEKRNETGATGHSYGEWVVTKAATQTENGIKAKTCTLCGDKVTETIPKLTPAPDDGTNSADDPFDDGYTPETKAPETSAPETNAPETESAAKKGCGASLAMTGVALVGACAAMLAVKRRKNEDD